MGAVRPRRRRGHALQVRGPRCRRHAAPARRSGRGMERGGAGERVGGVQLVAPLGRRRVAGAPARPTRHAAQPDVGLRGAPGLVAARPRLAGARGRARRLRHRARLHPRRADGRARAPVQRLVGLPGHRLLRAVVALGNARRLPRLRRRAAPPRRRRHRRLGARALPARRLGPRPLRRHRALRARGSPPGRAPRLGHAHLQLRPHRGAQLPARQRGHVGARLPRRRAARRCGRVDALPRLLARAGRVAARTCAAGARTSTRSSSSATSTRGCPTSRPARTRSPRSRPRGRA